MDKEHQNSLFERVQHLHSDPSHEGLLVPVDGPDLYNVLAAEAIDVLIRVPGKGVMILVDAATAEQNQGLNPSLAQCDRAWVFGKDGIMWPDWADNPSHTSSVRQSDRFLIILSSTLSVAVLGNFVSSRGDFQGGWTTLRSHVEEIIKELLFASDSAQSPDNTLLDREGVDSTSAISMRLMMRQLKYSTPSVLSLDPDKSDLINVLNILKAIAVKASTVEILYAFVGQIAKVIQVDRCSVVRVCDGEHKGRVLASHEDQSVRNHEIDLSNYPEVLKAVETKSKVLVVDTATAALVAPVRLQLQRARIKSVLVIPLILAEHDVGTFLLRAALRERSFTEREIHFAEIVAEAASSALTRAHLIEKIEDTNVRLAHLATTDGLTGLYNHRYFRERMDEEFSRAKRYHLPLCCLMCDIDNFKPINDMFGHLQGDRILREVADCIMSVVRKSDVVARYGGEEFAVILPQTDRRGALTEADRLLRIVATHEFAGLPKERRVTISIGVCVVDLSKVDNSESIVHAADEALYKAKRNGKNQFVISDR